MTAEEKTAREDLAYAYQLAAHFGWTDSIYTHLSLRLPGPNEEFLINPFGLNFAELTSDNLIKVDKEGNILSHTLYKVNQGGFVIHSAIHQAHPDLRCVMHTHTPVGMALSCLEEGLLPLTQHACFFYNRIGYHSFEGIVLDEEEQPRLLQALGSHKALILRNHGFLTAGRTIAEAFVLLYTLEKAAQAQLMAQSTGRPLTLIAPDIAEKTARQHEEGAIEQCDLEWEAFKRLLQPILSHDA